MIRSVPRILLAAVLVVASLASGSLSARDQATAQGSGPRLLDAGMDRLVFELSIPRPEVERLLVEGRAFDRLAIPGYRAVGEPGQPERLQAGILIGIPPQGDVSVRVLEAQVEELPGTYRLVPVLARESVVDPITGQPDPAGAIRESFTWDEEAYSQDALEPAEAVNVDEVGVIRHRRVARVVVQPIQYNPARGDVRVTRHLKVEVTFPGSQLWQPSADDQAQPDAFEPLFRSQLLNYEQARPWQVPRELNGSRTATSVRPAGDPGQAWYRMSVTTSGLYKLAHADLVAAGLAQLVAADPAYLQVWKDGQQVAVDFLGDADAVFEDDEALVFYADVTPTLYSLENVYWLTSGSLPGQRITTIDGTPLGQAPQAQFSATTWVETDRIFRGNLPMQDDSGYPRWYWRELFYPFEPSATVIAALPNAVADGYEVVMRVRLVSANSAPANPDHKVLIEINGHPLGENEAITWDGIAPVIGEVRFPAGYLKRGMNAIRLHVPGDLPGVSLEQAFLDWIELTYQTTSGDQDRFSFQVDAEGYREFELAGFTQEELRVYDISNPESPRRITGVHVIAGPSTVQADQGHEQAQVAADGQEHQVYMPTLGSSSNQRQPPGPGEFRLRFGLDLDGQAAFAVAADDTMYRVKKIVPDEASHLRSMENQADYLLITHSSFRSQAEVLADHRRRTGLSVATVDVQDIYDEFSNGEADPNAIRDFVAYAFHNWSEPAPAFVLLFGDGHYDLRMATGEIRTPSFIPPYMDCFDFYVCEVPGDNEYAAVSGDDRLPDLAIGRLPAKDSATAALMVAKIIDYETDVTPGAWRGSLTFVADNYVKADGSRDAAGDFEALADGIIDLLPAEAISDRVFFDPYPDDDLGEAYRHRTPPATTQAIVDSINQGRLFVNYIGHAAVNVWAHEWLFIGRSSVRNDVSQLDNEDTPSIFLDMSCLSGNFAEINYESLHETLLAWPAGGSVAGWAASGLDVANGHDLLQRGFYTAVFEDGVRDIGLATVAGKLRYWQEGNDREWLRFNLLDTFGLLGDPALQIGLAGERAAN